jgi:hypothetical protein
VKCATDLLMRGLILLMHGVKGGVVKILVKTLLSEYS